MPTNHHDVIVIGLGAMGSAAACHLARRGCRVLGLDRFAPPHSQGSSHGLTRIIREAYYEDPLYVPLVQRAYALWQDLEARTGRALLRPIGGVMVGWPDGELVSGALRSARQHGLSHEVLAPAEAMRRFPALRLDDDMVAVWEPRAGVLFPEICIEAHLSEARRHGADLRTGERVLRWQPRGDGVCVTTAQGEHFAGQLLVTAGAWARSLLPDLALPFTVERQVVCWFEPTSDRAAHAPAQCPIHLWETPPGHYFYGMPDFGDGVKVGIHHDGETVDPEQPRGELDGHDLAAIRTLLRRHLPSVAEGRLRNSSVCLYTNTPDGHFWIDRHPEHPQVLIASPCSGHGFKFSAAIGEALAQWLCDGAPQADLSRFASR
ncbi:MAG: N-methyl-L-tryptophan oxidase [Burkholderiaceae bacterium]